MPAGFGDRSVPFGPLTLTLSDWMLNSTPPRAIGFLATRDMFAAPF